jgi:hypothetical protein
MFFEGRSIALQALRRQRWRMDGNFDEMEIGKWYW